MGEKVCRERDSNSHAFVGRWILSPLRLPIPPSRHGGEVRNLTGNCGFLASPVLTVRTLRLRVSA
jgi:hypothetical protein